MVHVSLCRWIKVWIDRCAGGSSSSGCGSEVRRLIVVGVRMHSKTAVGLMERGRDGLCVGIEGHGCKNSECAHFGVERPRWTLLGR